MREDPDKLIAELKLRKFKVSDLGTLESRFKKVDEFFNK
jgi:hypothetical protein